MAHVDIEQLDPGDQLGSAEIPECCEVLMDPFSTGYQCGQCDAYINVDADRTVIYVSC